MSETRPAPLTGLTVVEISAFVAAPLGAMTLAQLGADVIRIDPIGGNIDANRWPINLGYIAEVQATGKTRGPLGNGLYDAYGPSFETSDGRQIMVAVISNKNWRGLGKATGLTEKLERIGPLLDVDLSTEGGRFEACEAIDAVVRPWFAAHTVTEAAAALSEAGVLQGGSQTFEELVKSDPRCSLENPLFSEIDQPGVGTVIAPRVPLVFSGTPAAAVVPAPSLGGDTAKVLSSVLSARANWASEK
ncbi:CoA transferase [Brevibacterium sp. GP-SGM9]|uniref:CoA transferase n=1 Tax=Brevibacterium sp. GP-SGM9 TaxID=3376990 RepID=UPI0039A44856